MKAGPKHYPHPPCRALPGRSLQPNGASHPASGTRLRRAVDLGASTSPGGPDGKGQAKGQARSARGEPRQILTVIKCDRAYTWYMTIALVALIVAACSLIWNIVTALHAWRTNMPSIKLDVRNFSSEELQTNLRNRGGSAIAITKISVIRYMRVKHKKPASPHPIYREYWQTIWEIPEGHRKDDVEGPSLPFTIAGYHNQEWSLHNWRPLPPHETQKARIDRISVVVELGTGKVVEKRIRKAAVKRAVSYLT
jgi:hypothetical protein